MARGKNTPRANGKRGQQNRRRNANSSKLSSVASVRVVSPPADPPTFVIAPWNSLTVELTIAVSTTPTGIAGGQIVNAVIHQLLLPTTINNLVVRVKDVMVWGGAYTPAVPVSPLQQLTVEIFNIQVAGTTDNAALQAASDSPGVLSWPRVGLRWPQVDSAIPISPSNPNQVIRISSLPASTVLVRIRVLWRFNVEELSRGHALMPALRRMHIVGATDADSSTRRKISWLGSEVAYE